MKETKPKAVIQSAQLTAYKLPKDVRALLDRHDKMRAYMMLGGKTPPNEIRLFRHDWMRINNLVSEQSDGKFSAATATYNGHPLIKPDDHPAPFALASEAA